MPLNPYAEPPANGAGFTTVRCMHDYHGDILYYIPDDKFQEELMGIIRPLWVNGYTFVIRDGVR